MSYDIRLLGYEGETVGNFTREALPERVLRPRPLKITAAVLDPEAFPALAEVSYERYELESFFDCYDGGPLAIYRRVA